MTEKGEELLPCPFCGESAELDPLDMDYATYGVSCSCGAQLTVAGSPVDAISAWNRRAHPVPKGEELVERLLSRADTMNGTRVGAGDGDTYTLGYYSKMDAALDRAAATALSERDARIAELEGLVERAFRAGVAYSHNPHDSDLAAYVDAAWRGPAGTALRASLRRGQ